MKIKDYNGLTLKKVLEGFEQANGHKEYKKLNKKIEKGYH